MIEKIGIVLWYIALAVMLFFGVKISKKKTWNEENMSFDQTKSFLGFCAVIICFHHMAQFTCAGWLNPKYIRHGLDIFVTAGYPMVAMFLFCSGYAMYKSAKSKSGFFRGNPANDAGELWGAYDNGLSNAYLVLKARDMGFDTLIMGMREADKLRELFAIPENEAILAVIALGYRAEEPNMPVHRPLDEVVKFF